MPRYKITCRVVRSHIIANDMETALADLLCNPHNYMKLKLEEETSLFPESVESQPDLHADFMGLGFALFD